MMRDLWTDHREWQPMDERLRRRIAYRIASSEDRLAHAEATNDWQVSRVMWRTIAEEMRDLLFSELNHSGDYERQLDRNALSDRPAIERSVDQRVNVAGFLSAAWDVLSALRTYDLGDRASLHLGPEASRKLRGG